ncbi:1497_t:CDS:2, partial [Gigaspora margarita]
IEHGNYYPNNANNKEYIREQIVNLAKSYNLSSKYTSFIALEMQNIKDNEKKKQEIMKTMAIEKKYKKIDTQDFFGFKNEHEKSLIMELEKPKEIENKKDAELKKIYDKKIITEFEKESENQNTTKIEKQECEKAMLTEKCKELQRKIELKKEQLKKENTIESQKKVEIQKKQLKKENVIESQKKEKACEYLSDQIKDTPTEKELLDCTDKYVIDNVTKKVEKDHKKDKPITIVQDAASSDKCEEIVSKQKDDGSIELDDSVWFELGAPKEDIITTIKKKITNEKLKSPEHSTSLSTAINLAYLKNAAS